MRELPTRIQRRRTKGFRLPPKTLCITRPGPWGNPYHSVLMFRCSLYHPSSEIVGSVAERFYWMRLHIMNLLQYDHIACWCKPTDPCHGDVLLALLAERMKVTT